LAAFGLAVAVAAGGASTGVAGIGSGTTASSANSAGSRGQARVNDRNSQAVQARLVAQGVRINARATDDSDNCVEHSHGQVQDYLRANPCVALHRSLFELRDRNGDVVLIAVAWVDMGDEATAREFHRLVDGSGTGNIVELSRERGRYRSVRFTGDFYASNRDGTVVVNAQAQPVARGWAGVALTAVVNDAVR
ncbi:MAG: hypothetical protein L0H64_03665, partial [Pseudonocardia sp.]|nr:hypothetical protein [Pseudonocardia sp.]